jgi:hypothetical protein
MNKKFIRQILYQTWGFGMNAPKDIYLEAQCLNDLPLSEYNKAEEYLIKNGYIEESGELNYFKMTNKGQDLLDNNELL